MALFILRLNIWLTLFASLKPACSSHFPDNMVTTILQYINEDRHLQGLPPLQLNSLENSLALKHSQDMANGSVGFGHEGFNGRVSAIQKSLGGVAFGENVAYGQMTAREVVDGWLTSAAHKKNIEGNFIFTGIGYARNKKGEIYFTQIFSR